MVHGQGRVLDMKLVNGQQKDMLHQLLVDPFMWIYKNLSSFLFWMTHRDVEFNNDKQHVWEFIGLRAFALVGLGFIYSLVVLAVGIIPCDIFGKCGVNYWMMPDAWAEHLEVNSLYNRDN